MNVASDAATLRPSAPRALRRGGRQMRYLAQFVLLEEKGMSWMAATAVLVVCSLVVAFVVWASIVQIEEVTVTSGTVVPKSKVHVVQHLEGGIVRELLVQDRQMVEAGQPLVRLDPVQARADLDSLRARQAALMLRAERLRAIADLREPDFSGIDARYAHLVKDHTDIFHAAMQRWMTQTAVIQGEVAQKNAEIAALERQMEATTRQIDLLAEEVEMLRTLFDAGHASKIRYFEVRRQHAAMQSELSRLEGDRDTAQKALVELSERQADLDSNVRQDALGELGTVTAELAQVNEALARSEDMVERLTIVSPGKGYVQNLQVRNVGAVIPAGGMLMEVVPVEDELLVETRVSTRDIGHVHPGQPATVKVSTYDFVRYGAVSGELLDVSATTYVDERDGQPYYKGTVRLSQPHVGDDPQVNRVMPGMTVQADIITGRKTLLQYLLKPIHWSLAQAFRER